MDLVRRVRRTIEEYGLLPRGCTVVVGVSGGPDSLCLLHLLVALRPKIGFDIQAAHLHHGYRGTDADTDAAFVCNVATSWGLPVVVERQNVAQWARQNSMAFEEAARLQRYAYLARLADATGASRIAVGHTADDQAETVLMHILRGSGMSGLRGMLPATPLSAYRLLPHSGDLQPGATPEALCALGDRAEVALRQRDSLSLVRPLMETRRAEIETYCAEHGLHPRFDRSNLDTTFFRNRLRHDLLPELAKHSPRIRERLCHTAAVVAADCELLTQMTDQAIQRVVVRRCERRELAMDRDAWRALPTSLQRATIRRGVFHLRPRLRDLGFVHTENARRLALHGTTGSRAVLPEDAVMEVSYNELVFRDAAQVLQDELQHPYIMAREPAAVRVPGCTALAGTPWALVASELPHWEMGAIQSNADPWTAYFDRERLDAPIEVRSRCPGDAFAPLGMEGRHAELSSFMINRKIPRATRENVPLLTAGGTIIWVCGRQVAEGPCVREGTKRVVQFSFQRLADVDTPVGRDAVGTGTC